MIVALAGRRIDAPDSKSKRFPEEFVDSVKRRLKDYFLSANAAELVCSAACGSDLIALQAAEELSMGTTVILPFDHDLFRVTSVVDRPGDWGLYYDKLLGRLEGSEKLVELKYGQDDPDVYLKTNIQILARAEHLARLSTGSLNQRNNFTKLIAVIVWEGKPKDSDDTTYHFMKEAENRKFQIIEIKIGA